MALPSPKRLAKVKSVDQDANGIQLLTGKSTIKPDKNTRRKYWESIVARDFKGPAKFQKKVRKGRKVVTNMIGYTIFLLFFYLATIFSRSGEGQTMYIFSSITNTLLSVADGRLQDPRSDYPVPQVGCQMPWMPSWQNVTSIADLWQYLQNPFLQALFLEYARDGSVPQEINNTVPYMFGYNKLIGRVRIRQLRGKYSERNQGSCEPPSQFKSIINGCYFSLGLRGDEQSTSYYGPNISEEVIPDQPLGDPFIWRSSSELIGRESYYFGEMWQYYPGDGFVAHLDSDFNKSAEILQALKDYDWIDYQTRAVFIDFNLFNANLRLLGVVRLLAEFPLGGGILTSSDIQVANAYLTSVGLYFIELLLVCLIVYMTIVEIYEIYVLRWSYFRLWQYRCPFKSPEGIKCGKILKCSTCKLRWEITQELVFQPIRPREEKVLQDALDRRFYEEQNQTELEFMSGLSKTFKFHIFEESHDLLYSSAKSLIPESVFGDRWKCEICTTIWDQEWDIHKRNCIHAKQYAKNPGNRQKIDTILPEKSFSPTSWNYLDLIILTFFWVVIAARIRVYIFLYGPNIAKSVESLDEYIDFQTFVTWAYYTETISAIIALLLLVKFPKIFGEVPNLSVITSTLGNAFHSLFIFFVVLVILIFFFALSFHLSFGTELDSHHSLASSMITLVLYQMGAFDYQELALANRFMAPILFSIFLFFGFFLALTLIISIIDFAFQLAQTKEENHQGKLTNLRAFALASYHRPKFFSSIRFIKWLRKKIKNLRVKINSQTKIDDGYESDSDDTVEDNNIQQMRIKKRDDAREQAKKPVDLDSMSLEQIVELHRHVLFNLEKKIQHTIDVAQQFES